MSVTIEDIARVAWRLSPAGYAAHLSNGHWKKVQHLDLLSHWLVEAARGERSRILIQMPPRHGKSQLVSHWFPVWFLDQWPAKKIILASYEATFAASWGRKVRNTIQEHQDALRVRVASDSSAAGAWDTTAGGGMVTAGAGGPITGRGANLLIVDDPIKNAEEANSQTYRDRTWDWWQSTGFTRLEPGGVAVLVFTRWHEDDLGGRLLRQQGEGGDRWDVLRLPAIAEEHDALGRVPGDPLWPERYDAAALAKIRGSVGEYVWTGLYQQRPCQPGGSLFKTEWWTNGRNRYDVTDQRIRNECIARWISWDTANTDKDGNAYSACVVGELAPDYRLVIREVWRGRLQFPDLVRQIEDIATRYNQDGKLNNIIVEDKASGTPAIQTIMASSPHWLRQLLAPFQPSGDKVARASQASVWCQNGCVLLPHPSGAAPWLFDFEAELFAFPQSQYKDQVDAFGQLIFYLEHYLAAGWEARGAAARAADVVPAWRG